MADEQGDSSPVANRYGDLQLPPGALARATGNDAAAAARFLAYLTSSATRGVWLALEWPSQAHLLPVAAAAGFKPHHAREGAVTLAFWPPSLGADPTPPYSHLDVGCAAVAVDAAGRVLVVRDRFDASGFVNVPGGHLDEGEGFEECAVREAREEAGVRLVPVGVLAARACNNADRLPPGAEGAAEGALSADARALRASGRAGALGGAPPPREGWPYAGARAGWEHRSRFGTAHLGVYVLCHVADAEGGATSADPAEVASAEWLAVDDALAAAAPFIALILAAARDAGALDAAARASALAAAGAPRADVDAARRAAAGHCCRSTRAVEVARVPPPRGAEPGARPGRLGYPSRFFSALPPGAWAAGAAAARAARGGGGGGGDDDDVPTLVESFDA